MIDRRPHRLVYTLVPAAACLLALLLATHAAGAAQPGQIRPTPTPQIGPLASTVGINGALCTYATVGAAMAAAGDGDTLYLTGGQTYYERLGSVDKDLTLVAALPDCSGLAPAGAVVTIDGGGASVTQGGLLSIGPLHTLTLRHIRLQNAGATEGGIAYVGPGAALVLDGCQITDGQASSAGGGVFVADGGTLTLSGGSAIYGNDAASEGGGILVTGRCTVGLSGSSVISGNTSSVGGGMYVRGAGSTIVISQSRVDENHTTSAGGGIRLYGDSVLALTGSTLNQNTSGDAGGGLAVYRGQVTMDGGEIAGNDAGLTVGGGIMQQGGAITLTGTLIDGNTAQNWGGGIYCSAGTLLLQTGPGNEGSLSQNEARLGGGLYAGGGTIEVRGLPGAPWTIAGNHVTNAGGAGAVFTGTQLSLVGDVRVQGNQAPGSGGGFYVGGGTLWARPSGGVAPALGPGNTSTAGSGGAIYLAGGTLHLEGVTLGVPGGGNSAAWSGGGIYAEGGTVLLDDVQAAGNGAGEGGGAIYADGSRVTIRAGGTGCNPHRLPGGAYCSAFRENQGGAGGAIYLDHSTTDIAGTVFLSNQGDPSSPGSALLVYGGTASVTNTLFSDNNVSVVHIEAGGVYHSHSSTYAGNSGWPLYVFSSARVTLTNNIIWSNDLNPYYQAGAAVSGTCNDTPALLGGAGNISVDPHLVTDGHGDYHLAADSPAVDACGSGPGNDLDGIFRPHNGDGIPSAAEYDMGAFEYHRETVYLPVAIRQ